MEALRERDDFMAGQKIKIQSNVMLSSITRKLSKESKIFLLMRQKKRKILDKLKEKQKAEFKKAMAKKEAKLTDEVVVTRFKAYGGRL